MDAALAQTFPVSSRHVGPLNPQLHDGELPLSPPHSDRTTCVPAHVIH